MAKLDETGLEVACCRHGLGLKALNMFRGEMYVHCIPDMLALSLSMKDSAIPITCIHKYSPM